MSDRFREVFWFTRLRRIVTSAVAVAALIAAGLGAYAWYTPDLHCADGVRKPDRDAECLGVSTGDFNFGSKRLTEVIAAIARENDDVKDTYATVALLLPLTRPDESMEIKVLHELQGAFLAQYHANHDDNGVKPKIRIALANVGKDSKHWQRTVGQLKSMTDGPDHLRVVSGVATSSAETKDAVEDLTAHGIPVVGTTITADDIANNNPAEPRFPGLARVSPTNKDEADALSLFSRPRPGKALLVQDTRPGDNYNATLTTAFARRLSGARTEPAQFESPKDPNKEGTTANKLRRITSRICDSDADTIFFAGRHIQLRQFVNELGLRGCTERKFTVLTGDEGSYLGRDGKLDMKALRDGSVKVQYASLAHPDAWVAGKANTPTSGGDPAAYQTFRNLLAEAATKKVGPIGDAGEASLTDGQAIIAYDAMTTAVTGIREAITSGSVPLLADVGQYWADVKGTEGRINGASGWICLDNNGNPYNKAIPIVELTPEGGQRLVKVAWPKGTPLTEPCIPPAVP